MFEHSSDLAIARQSAILALGRQRLRAGQRTLKRDALELCKRPTTLGAAALTGAVIARVGPFAHVTATDTAGNDAARSNSHSSTVLRTVLISGLSAVVRNIISPI